MAQGETKSLETAYYAEYSSTGPGASVKTREPLSHQLTAEEAKQFETNSLESTLEFILAK